LIPHSIVKHIEAKGKKKNSLLFKKIYTFLECFIILTNTETKKENGSIVHI